MKLLSKSQKYALMSIIIFSDVQRVYIRQHLKKKKRIFPHFQNCIWGCQALFAFADRFCKIPCILQFGGPKLFFSPLPLHFSGCHRFADCVRVFSGRTVTHFWGRGVRAGWWRRMMSSPLSTQSSSCACLRAGASVSSFCTEVTSLACCTFICDVTVSTLTACPTRLSVLHLSVILQHCARLRDRDNDQGGQSVTINSTHAVAAITFTLMPVTWYPLPKILGKMLRCFKKHKFWTHWCNIRTLNGFNLVLFPNVFAANLVE